MAEFLQTHQPPPRHQNGERKDVPNEVHTREKLDDELTANSPVTWEYPSPPRYSGGAVINMTRDLPNNNSSKRNPLLFGASAISHRNSNTRHQQQTTSKRVISNLHLQRSSSSGDVEFQEEYDVRDEQDNHGLSSSHFQGQQPQHPRDDEMQHLQPHAVPSSSQRFYTRQLSPLNSKRRIQPSHTSEQNPKSTYQKHSQHNNYRSRFSSQQDQQQQDALIINRHASRGHKPIDEENQEEETYQDDGRYCCGCGLSTIVIIGCLIGLAISIGAIAGLLIWDQRFLDSSSQKDQGGQIPTVAPTIAAPSTSLPTPGPLGTAIWEEYKSTNAGSMFGSSVFVRENWVAIGAPLGESVTTYVQVDDGQGRWDQLPGVSVPGETAGSNFGADIHLGKVYSAGPNSIAPFLVVGAPTANGGGKVYFYSRNQIDINSGDWIQQDAPLTAENGEISTRTAAAGFGSAVAASDTLRVVVGAPTYGVQDTGKVFTYQYLYLAFSKKFQAEVVVGGTLSGTGTPGSNFGYDVDITEDANSLVVGEPGTSSFFIYKRETDQWITEFSFTLSEVTDLGSSVTFISPTFVAVGTPSANHNAGFVALFAYDNAKGRWRRLNVNINGNQGDRIGAKGTISGSQGGSGTHIVVASESGIIIRYDLVGDELLIKRFDIALQAPVSAIDVGADEKSFAILAGYASNDFAALYGASGIGSAPSPSDNAETPASHPTQSPSLGSSPPQTTTSLPVQTPPSAPWSALATFQGPSGSGHGYGTSVAISGNGSLLMIGEPGALNETGITDFREATGASTWSSVENLVANGTKLFGYALDTAFVGGESFLLVGAPETQDGDSNSVFGSAHVYRLDSSKWSPVGDALIPPKSTLETGGNFGSAVSMAADIQRVVVAAPRTSDWTFDNVGRVYTFDWNGTDWGLVDASLRGTEQSFFGSSVSLSADGQSLVVGSPGSDQALYYEWIEGLNQWNQVFTSSSAAGEAFGETVSLISENPYSFVVGGPAYNNGRGIVRIFSTAEVDGPFTTTGLEISGIEDGDRVGRTLCGAQNKIAVGTDTGYIRIYTLHHSMWVLDFTINVGETVVSLEISDDSNTLIAGLSTEEVQVHDISSS